ncbi:endoplasmic reticulum membrane-associated RNA degradation protein [Acrasis kona]|uniref:Endoplasmic reticulum membrane-associated RNA degradation protein n=1 Tax=Acrasis kona TaxID=1008807 RepID=A0AAW2YY06_9EUKA
MPYDGFLTTNIRNMLEIADDHETYPLQSQNYINNDGTLNWDILTKKNLSGGDYPDDQESDILLFKQSANHLKAAIVQQIHPFVQNLFTLSNEEILVKYNGKTTFLPEIPSELSNNLPSHYTKENFIFLDVLNTYRKAQFQLSFAIGISFLESSINGIVVSESEGQLCTSRQLKINTMLSNENIKNIFGIDVIFLLRLFCGPLQGMNLRNIVWHGFLVDNEFDSRYSSFLILLLLSLPLVSKKELKSLHEFDVPMHQQTFHIPFESTFIPAAQLEQWKECLHDYKNQNPYHVVTRLYPLLEHAMRCLFSKINKCEDRVMSAEVDNLYTTFDEILNPFVYDTGTPNGLYDELGDSIMLMLFDLLVWKDGPRVRDKLSHGAIDPNTLPTSIVDRTVFLCFILCKKYSDTTHYESVAFEPMFHPQIFLHADLIKTRDYMVHFYKNYVDGQPKRSSSDKVGLEGLNMSKEEEANLLVCIGELDERINKLIPNSSSMFNAHESDLLNSYNHLCNPCMIPRRYTGKVGNNVSVELQKIKTLRLIVVNSRQVLQPLLSAYDKYNQMVCERKAYAKHRNAFEKLKQNMFSIYLLMLVVLKNVEILTLSNNPYVNGHELRDALLKLVNSLQVGYASQPRTWRMFRKVLEISSTFNEYSQ